jgi:type II secretory pathway component PulL
MWWIYVIVVVLAAVAVYGFVSLASFETRWLSHKTSRRAEDLYDRYADPPAKRRRRS